MGKISNVTNSVEPTSIVSRIFVGNLNTFTLSKDDVETIFRRYGKIIGISMHKGYAFIQYTNEYDARNSVAAEDQRIYAGQPLDVNMAAEPKPNRPSRKRPQGAGAEWDHYYNTPVGLMQTSTLAPPIKRARPDLLTALTVNNMQGMLKKPTLVPVAGGGLMLTAGSMPRMMTPLTTGRLPPVVTMMSPSRPLTSRPLVSRPSSTSNDYYNAATKDILICGSCKQVFTDVDKLTSHKKSGCRLRFVCKCEEKNTLLNGKAKSDCEPEGLSCATCSSTFESSWDLCQHCQTEHGMAIYTTTTNACCTESSVGDSPSPRSSITSDMDASMLETSTVISNSSHSCCKEDDKECVAETKSGGDHGVSGVDSAILTSGFCDLASDDSRYSGITMTTGQTPLSHHTACLQQPVLHEVV